ncbi:hypothetical protein [Pseudomonas sp. MPB26]|uniref:hypothetical protein n=1 Tax=Pseudomonas sp. MPB26 TaxID=3388491 RepID=UPI0039846FB2
MNPTHVCILLRKASWMIALWLASAQAYAGFAEIQAQFRPDPANPTLNQFKNTTPSSGYCDWFSAFCSSRGLFSLNLPLGGLPQTTGGPVQARHTDPRQGAYLKVPSDWRIVTVTNDQGDSAQLEIRISGIGGRHDLGGSVHDITGGGDHEQLWSTGRWHKAPTPCVATGGLNGAANNIIWFWLVPENAGACATQALFDIPDYFYRYVHFGYELRTPNPLKMPAGIYRGTQVYTVGPGMDFDLGDLVLPHDNIATLEFVLDVDHILKVEVPPGGNRVELEPSGGWQSWLQNGRKPSRLARDQTFSLWASSPFKMILECPEPLGNTCSVANAAGDRVPLDVAVTLPFGLTDANGRAVNRLPLRLDGSGSEFFQPAHYVDRKPATLHFSVSADGAAQMLDRGGKTYSGTATVVWDSEI